MPAVTGADACVPRFDLSSHPSHSVLPFGISCVYTTFSYRKHRNTLRRQVSDLHEEKSKRKKKKKGKEKNRIEKNRKEARLTKEPKKEKCNF